jgi:rubrerythrin
MNDSVALSRQINCLSMLEHNTFVLYQNLADKSKGALIKSLLLSIAQDSSKHATLLKGVGDTISVLEVKSKDCAKAIGKIWLAVDNFSREVAEKESDSITSSELYERLAVLEGNLAEEYDMFVRLRTLKYLTSEINQLYNIDLEKVKAIFVSIIKDEERHREILANLMEQVKPKEKPDNTPVIKYRSPDSWIRPIPNTP